VVARDKAGNVTKSPISRVTVPFDDGNPAFDDAYAGTWETLTEDCDRSSIHDVCYMFLQRSHASSEPGATFATTFTGSELEWFVPRGYSNGATSSVSMEHRRRP
jgi:hypothetical protein